MQKWVCGLYGLVIVICPPSSTTPCYDPSWYCIPRCSSHSCLQFSTYVSLNYIFFYFKYAILFILSFSKMRGSFEMVSESLHMPVWARTQVSGFLYIHSILISQSFFPKILDVSQVLFWRKLLKIRKFKDSCWNDFLRTEESCAKFIYLVYTQRWSFSDVFRLLFKSVSRLSTVSVSVR